MHHGAPGERLIRWKPQRRLDAHPTRGLCHEEARTRLGQHGENRLATIPPRAKWIAFFDQFRNLLMLVLIGAAVLAGAIGDIKDAVVIWVVVFNAQHGAGAGGQGRRGYRATCHVRLTHRRDPL